MLLTVGVTDKDGIRLIKKEVIKSRTNEGMPAKFYVCMYKNIVTNKKFVCIYKLFITKDPVKGYFILRRGREFTLQMEVSSYKIETILHIGTIIADFVHG